MSHPVPIFGTQNLQDDDSEVIDSYFKESPDPPVNLKDAIEPIQVPVLPALPQTTRMLNGTIILDSSYVNPTMILSADDKRVSVFFTITSTDTSLSYNDYILMGDQRGNVSSAANGATSAAVTRLRAQAGFAPTQVSIIGHTGAIWVQPNPSITHALELTWIVVAK